MWSKAFFQSSGSPLLGVLFSVILQTGYGRGEDAGEMAVSGKDLAVASLQWLSPITPASDGLNSSGILYERWTDMPGSTLREARQSGGAARPPKFRGFAAALESPRGDGVNYAGVFRGFIQAPRSGKVRFLVSSDDNSELWLSSGEDSFKKKRIASIMGDGTFGYTKPGQSDRVASQWSLPVELTEGSWYYIEAHHKQGRHDAHFLVRWHWDGDGKAVPIPTELLRPWTGTEQDANDDGLPDDWQKRTGLEGLANGGAWADADRDGVMNIDEFSGGTDPLKAGTEHGSLLWEIWHGVAGRDVADLKRAKAFAGPPDRALFVKGSTTPDLTATNLGSRLSGYIVPQVTGEYEFFVSGDDSAELWISGDGDPLKKEMVAFSDRWRGRDEGVRSKSQISRTLKLNAGSPCYIEVLHKDDKHRSWVGLKWRMNGERDFREIDGELLHPPAAFGHGVDRKALPGDWLDRITSGWTEEQKRRNPLSEHGDPDGDRIPNWLEARLDSDPLGRTIVLESMVRDWWYGTPGTSLQMARTNGVFTRPPSGFSLVAGASAEKDTTDGFVSRMRGYLDVPESGVYRFGISGDDHCELWISETGAKFHKRRIAAVAPASWQDPNGPAYATPGRWGQYPSQQSEPVMLRKGQRVFVEVVHQDRGGPDHVTIAWRLQRKDAPPRWATEPIPAKFISSFEGDDDDLDDDYLPDSWERKHGLNALDSGFRNRVRQGELGDFDRDGLTNHEEFLLGTNPARSDSDGDGIIDRDEIRVYGSDPVRRDAVPPVKLTDLDLGSSIFVPGQWISTPEGALRSLSRRSSAEFEVYVPAPGIYLLELRARAVSPHAYVPVIPVVASVSGVEIGRGEITEAGTTNRWLTQWLSAGRHVVRIEDRNIRLGLALEIDALALYRHEGEDSDKNSVPDWMEGLFKAASGTDIVSMASPVSPFCLEGTWRIAGSTRVATEGGEVEIRPGILGRWFSNVPLDDAGETPVFVRHENGAFEERHQLIWSATNILDCAETLVVRPGDSLKLEAVPRSVDAADGEMSVTILLDGAELPPDKETGHRIVRFEKPGRHSVAARVAASGGLVERSVSVEVVAADFGEPFNITSGIERAWSVPGLDRRLVVESDPGLSLTELPSAEQSGRRFNAFFPEGSSGTPSVVARISAGGPIAATTKVNAFWIVSARDSRDARVVEVLPDGTRVVEFAFTIDGLIPADLSLRVDLFVPDAVFANGSTSIQLGAGDFDVQGVAKVVVYKAPGTGVAKVCHRIFSYAEDGRSDLTK